MIRSRSLEETIEHCAKLALNQMAIGSTTEKIVTIIATATYMARFIYDMQTAQEAMERFQDPVHRFIKKELRRGPKSKEDEGHA